MPPRATIPTHLGRAACSVPKQYVNATAQGIGARAERTLRHGESKEYAMRSNGMTTPESQTLM